MLRLSALGLAIVLCYSVSAKANQPLEQGGGAGRASAEGALQRVGQQMRQAEQRIAEQDTSAGTQELQQRAIDDLTELIRQMAKKCGASGQGLSPTPPSPAAPAGSMPSRSPAPASVTRVGQAAAGPGGAESVRQLNRRAWGHLPARLRQPVLEADFERFLPKYQQLIQRYFARLAEEVDSP
jgi:hypothetical protein